MLQSLAAFNTYVDKRTGSKNDKAALKVAGQTLARAAVTEAVAHANKHLNAAVKDNPDNAEVAARVAQMQKYLASVRLSDG